MSTDRPAVMPALEQALAEAQAAVKSAEDQASTLDQQLDAIVADRGEALVELARHYLPAITQESIDATFAEVRADLRNIVVRKQRQERKLQEQIAALTEARDRLHLQLDTVTRELNHTVAQREQAEAALAQRLRDDAEFQRLSGELKQARFQLEENERRLAEIHAEAREKLPAYEKSRLFQYLHRRNFAEPTYQSRGLTRRLDRWVANLIDYGRARQSYRFLRVTPELADAEVRRRRDDLGRLEGRVAQLDAAASLACGLPSIVERGEQLGSQRDQLLDQLAQNGQRLEPLEHEYAQLAQSQGPFYEEAIAHFRQFLDAAHAALLEQRAAVTPEQADDEIVVHLRWLDEQIDQHKQTLDDSRRRRHAAEQQVRGLRYVTRRCQRSNIDSDRCFFAEGFDIQRLLRQFENGEIDEHKLLRSIRDGRRFHPTWAEQAGEKIGAAFEQPAAQAVVDAATAAAAEGIHWVAQRHSKGFTRDKGF